VGDSEPSTRHACLSDPAGGVVIRSYGVDDYPELRRIQQECFPPPFPEALLWTRQQIASHQAHFPDGALCAEINGVMVGSASALVLRWHPGEVAHTWAEASADGFLSNHDPRGNMLYGVDIAVSPGYRRRGVARALYQARYALVRRLQLDGFISGSRLSGYHRVQESLSIEDYARQVVAGMREDPVITPQLRSGLRALQLVRGYLPDAESADAALLMAWLPGSQERS
jgi:GNAT superfamily N-acetyltransferase